MEISYSQKRRIRLRSGSWPPTANGRHQQQHVNMKRARSLDPRATHENTLVMRSSFDDDEDQASRRLV
jgi:hypothetical protein